MAACVNENGGGGIRFGIDLPSKFPSNCPAPVMRNPFPLQQVPGIFPAFAIMPGWLDKQLYWHAQGGRQLVGLGLADRALAMQNLRGDSLVSQRRLKTLRGHPRIESRLQG